MSSDALPRRMNVAMLVGMSVKQQVLQVVSRLPDDADFRDVTEEIAFLAAIREAEQDMQEGRVITNEQMKSRLGEWTGN